MILIVLNEFQLGPYFLYESQLGPYFCKWVSIKLFPLIWY